MADPSKAREAEMLQEQADYKHCTALVDKTLNNNLWLRHLIDSMEKMGCDVTRDFFKCLPCNRPVEGFYERRLGVVICQNYAKIPGRVEETMVHEAIHAFDYCRADIDTSDCVQVACSEIRAASLSGQCSWSHEVLRGNSLLRRQQQRCVRRRAELALQQLPQCQGKAQAAVARAWERCSKDREPFETLL